MKNKYLFLAVFAVLLFSCTENRKTIQPAPNDALYSNISERIAWETQRLADPESGKIPRHIRQRELEFSKTLPLASPFRGVNWVHQGPYNVGGRTRGGVVDIDNPNRILAGGVSGGIWISENAGNSWEIVTLPEELHNVSCLVQDSRKGKHHIWYYGTGEAYGNSASANGAYFAGNGMYKSVDSGRTWVNLPATASGTVVFDKLWDVIWNISIDPSVDSLDIVYAATLGAIYRSQDGGQNWNRVLGGNTSNFAYFTNVLVTPKGIKYATLSKDGPNNGIWRSKDGINWTNITPDSFPPDYDRIVMDYNPLNENRVYFLAHTPGYGKLGLGYRGTEDWNSLWAYQYIRNDGDSTDGKWINLSNNMPAHAKKGFDDFNAQGSYNLAIKFKPDDSLTLFIAGTNIYRSTDAFTSDSNTVQIGGYGVHTKRPKWTVYPNHHPDQHVLEFDPGNSNILYSFNDGGVFRTQNCMQETVVWESLNKGYLTTQCYAINFEDTAGSEIMIAGFQDNGNYFSNSHDVKAEWIMPLNGDGSYNYIASNREYYLFSTQLGRIVKAKLDKDGNRQTFTRIDPIGAKDYLFINPFVVDPNDENILYLPAGHHLWRNNQLKSLPYIENYDSITTGWTKLQDSLDIPNRTFTAIAVSTENPKHRVYLGTSARYIYRVDDANIGEPVVERISDPQLRNGYVSCIAVDKHNADHVMVVYSNYKLVSLVYSNDGGDSWEQVAGNLEEKTDGSGNGPSVRWAEIAHVNNEVVYLLGTSTGLYASMWLDGMDTKWFKLAQNSIGNVVIETLKFRESDGFLMVGTHGNGIYTTYLKDAGQILSMEANEQMPFRIYPNPARNYLFTGNNVQPGSSISIYNLKGELVQHSSLDRSRTVNVRNLVPGVYLIRVGKQTTKFVKR